MEVQFGVKTLKVWALVDAIARSQARKTSERPSKQDEPETRKAKIKREKEKTRRSKGMDRAGHHRNHAPEPPEATGNTEAASKADGSIRYFTIYIRW